LVDAARQRRLASIFGARLLRERTAPMRIVGAACIVIGVISLAFSD
jgi:drug/metabolite transporter (DMT)-like permease